MKPTSRALLGLFWALPFVLLNMIVGKRIEPFISWLRPTAFPTLREYIAFLVAVSLLLVGAFISAQSLFEMHNGRRDFYPLNFVVSIILLLMSISLTVLFFHEIYRCDFLLIANCD
jgi:hypothetical protein